MSNLACPTSYDYFLNTVFDPKDREKFEKLVALIEIKRPSDIPFYTVLTGPSGSGKSILLNLLYSTLFDDQLLYCDIYNSNSFIPMCAIYLIQDDVPVQIAVQNAHNRDLERNHRFIFTTNRDFEKIDNMTVIRTSGRRVDKHILFSRLSPAMRCEPVVEAFKTYCIDKLISGDIDHGE